MKLRERAGRVRRRVVKALAGVGIQAADTAVDGAAGADGITGGAGASAATGIGGMFTTGTRNG